MVTLIGRAEAGELFGMLVPVKVAAVHHASTHLGGMSVHVLRRAVRHDVATPLEGTAVDGSGKGVVHDEGHAVAVCHEGKALDVEDLAAGVGDGLAEEALRVGAEFLLDALVIPFGIHEGAFYAQLLHRHTEEVVRTAIDGVGGDEMVACLADVEDGVEVGCLTAGGQHGTHTAFQGGYLAGHRIVRGVGQSGIEITLVFEVEEACHLLACLVAECGTLVDGQLLWFALFGFPSTLYADGLKFSFHCRYVGFGVYVRLG